MTWATRLGIASRRRASIAQIQAVKELDGKRLERFGATPAELNKRFARCVENHEARVAALEAQVFGTDKATG